MPRPVKDDPDGQQIAAANAGRSSCGMPSIIGPAWLCFTFGNISHAMKPELTFAFGLILGCAVDPAASAQTPAGLDIQLCPSQVGKAGETRAPL